MWNDTSIRNDPILPAVGPGSDPKALATERVIGKITPPPRAVYVSSTCPIFSANSAISGFAAIPVRNIADAAYVVWNDTSIRNDPILPAVGPGSDPKAPATERVIGKIT